MNVNIQKGFWQDLYIGTTRTKLEELYRNELSASSSEREVMIKYWARYEYLPDLLGDKWSDFNAWFLKKATWPDTITRCIRSLKEEGIIKQIEWETSK